MAPWLPVIFSGSSACRCVAWHCRCFAPQTTRSRYDSDSGCEADKTLATTRGSIRMAELMMMAVGVLSAAVIGLNLYSVVFDLGVGSDGTPSSSSVPPDRQQ